MVLLELVGMMITLLQFSIFICSIVVACTVWGLILFIYIQNTTLPISEKGKRSKLDEHAAVVDWAGYIQAT